ncbi:uncharacterized protein LOC100284430 [Zea mays]|uniref:Remorin C-terminal domain-containing protein n=1 Tax=Zea mays TaxID=4577 RepID=C4J1J2_MAIZE|nr:uncharacterized protein LOC100284430 [Zea mays]ACR35042.1 unknown [Zea mays]|eukprot:NP_001150797.2 DNA binding protein [Zea mays]
MAYERIHEAPQMVAISPTRLRMKLLGSNHKDDPTRKTLQASRLDDDDHPNNSLLPQELDEEYPKDHRSDSSRSRSDASHDRISGSDDDSGTNFEFCKDERAALPASAAPGPFFRQQVPSKWNDAEKWIAGRHHRHVVHSNPVFSKKPAAGAPTELSSNRSSHKKPRFSPAAVSTRDVGTEMTPAASQEQSRSGTPAGAATPALSPLCSAPSSPRRGGSSSVPERELRLRTRREIAALGLQLGKMSIASWASKEEGLLAAASPEKDKRYAAVDTVVRSKAFEARAAAWEESNKCKLAARYQRKEAKIEGWESLQKCKFEAKLRQAEARAEQMKARAKQDLAKRLSALSHKVEGKQARVEARRGRQASRLARQVERIRETGRVPCRLRRCCAWFL